MKNKVIFIDIDGTICITNHGDYTRSKPIYKRIQKINELYNNGNVIVYWTSRGTMTNTDWRSLTEEQLENWGCKYHRLQMRKPEFDICVDDKAVSLEQFFK